MKSKFVSGVTGCAMFGCVVFAGTARSQPASPNASHETPANELLLVDGEPIVKTWVVPEYPPELAAQKIAGQVTVSFVVDEKGLPRDLSVTKSSDARFNAAVLKAFSACTFQPAVEQGRPIAAGVKMTWHFRLPYHPSNLMPPEESYPHMLPKTPAVAQAMPDAQYPEALADRQLAGEVLFELTISPEGAVSEAKILGATHVEFVRPALDAVKLWKFTPAKQGELAIADLKRAPISFVYQSRDATDKRTQLEANGFSLEASGESGATTFDVAPTVIAMADPVFPLELLKSGETGEAEVAFSLNLQGVPENISIRSATPSACGAAVSAALESTAFSPAMLRGQAVAVKLVKKHKFVLPTEAAQPDEPAEARLLRALRAGETIAAAKGLDGKLHPVWRAPPVYPAALKTEHPKGTATIEFVIDRTGRVRVPRIVSATQDEFGWSAATALSQWVFDPPTRGGQPTDVRVQIPFQFSPP